MPRLPFGSGRMSRAWITSSMFCWQLWAAQKLCQSWKAFLSHPLPVEPKSERPVYLVRVTNRLNEAKNMNHWELYKRILRTLLVAVSFLAASSIQDAAGYLSRTPTAFSEDGRILLVQMEELVVWDLETKALVAKIPGLHCEQVALLKQEGWVLCVERSVTIYDWKNRVSVATIPPESPQLYRLLAY